MTENKFVLISMFFLPAFPKIFRIDTLARTLALEYNSWLETMQPPEAHTRPLQDSKDNSVNE